MELIPICEKDLQLAPTVWYALSPTGSIPSMRVGHTAVFVKDTAAAAAAEDEGEQDGRGSVYLIGGANPRECFDQIHRLDLSTHQWSLLAGASIGSEGRYEHACFKVSGSSSKVHVFGGANLQTNLNDVLCLDLGCNEMAAVKNEGKAAPKERTIHTGVVFKNRLVVFGGGSEGCRALDDTQVHLFDVASSKWLSLPLTSKPEERPGARQGHVMVSVDAGEQQSIYLHGGMDGPTFYDDLWLLDLVKFCWSKQPASSSVLPSARAAHAGVSSASNIFLFGGLTSSAQASDELWKCHTGEWAKAVSTGQQDRCCSFQACFSRDLGVDIDQQLRRPACLPLGHGLLQATAPSQRLLACHRVHRGRSLHQRRHGH